MLQNRHRIIYCKSNNHTKKHTKNNVSTAVNILFRLETRRGRNSVRTMACACVSVCALSMSLDPSHTLQRLSRSDHVSVKPEPHWFMMLRVNRAVSISFKGLLSDVNRCPALRSRLHRLFILLHKGKNRLQLPGVPRLVRPIAEGLSCHVMNFTFEVHAEVTQWREGREIREQTVLRCDAGGCGGVVKNVT